MLNGTRRRLIRLEDHVAGIGPGCRVCRPMGDIQITDDHGYAGLPAICTRCGRRVAQEAIVHVHVVGAHLPLILELSLDASI